VKVNFRLNSSIVHDTLFIEDEAFALMIAMPRLYISQSHFSFISREMLYRIVHNNRWQFLLASL
jgi:hypothetical protein